MNNNPILMQQLLQQMAMQQPQQQITPEQALLQNLNSRVAMGNGVPLTPEQQAWANSLPRTDTAQMNPNVNYMPTIEQINKMNMLNRYGLNTEDRENIRRARERYDDVLKGQQ